MSSSDKSKPYVYFMTGDFNQFTLVILNYLMKC